MPVQFPATAPGSTSTTRGAASPAAVRARALAATAIPFGPAPITANVAMIARIASPGPVLLRDLPVARVDRVLRRRGAGPHEQADDHPGQEAEDVREVRHGACAGGEVPGRVRPLQDEPQAED